MIKFKQDLYYGNMPVDRKLTNNKLGFLRNLLQKKSFIDELENPYFIYTGTNYIKILDKRFLLTKTFNKLKKKEILFFLYEPMSLYLEGKEHNRGFYTEFTGDEDYDLIRSEELDSIQKFACKYDLNITVCTGDYNCEIMQKNYNRITIKCLDIFLRQHPSYNRVYTTNNVPIEKKLWSGNWRYTAHRHIIAAYMTNTDCILSWHVNAPGKILKNLNWLEYNSFINKKIIDGIKTLRQKTFSIDHNEVQSEAVEGVDDFTIPGDGQPLLSKTLSESYKRSFCAVVTETRFAQPTANLSEKTTNAIFHNRPFIIVGPPHSLEYARKLGFKTFDKWWDESYDAETNHQTRMTKILNLIESINSKTILELRAMHKDMQTVLQHNKKIVEALPYNKEFTNSSLL